MSDDSSDGLSTFSFSTKNVTFESSRSTNSNSTMSESNLCNVSSSDDVVNGLEQQKERSVNGTELVGATIESDEEPAIVEEPPDSTSTASIQLLYKPEIKFSNRDDLDKYIDDLKCFRYKSKNNTKEATVSYYICSQVPKRQAHLCPSKLKVFENKKTRDFCVYVTTFEHDHENIAPKQNPVSQENRDKIYSLHKDYYMKAATIHKYFRDEYPEQTPPTIKQIRQVLPKEKEKHIPKTKTYGEMIEWCRLMEKIPDGEDDAFVLDHMHNQVDDSFAFVVSTKRLLKMASKQKNICADGTYKMMWEDFPVVAVGHVDRMKKFHMIGLCITSNERESEYSFVFKTIAAAIKKHVNVDFEPEVLISDAAFAIRNGYYHTYKSAKHNVICWAHLARHITDFKFKSPENKKNIQRDIRVLQTSPNQERFEHACELFLQKYESIEPEFCAYMKRTWFGNNSQNWYTGYAPFAPEVLNFEFFLISKIIIIVSLYIYVHFSILLTDKQRTRGCQQYVEARFHTARTFTIQ